MIHPDQGPTTERPNDPATERHPDSTRALTDHGRMRVASAPVSFGVDEVIADDAWMPGPDEVLDWMFELGYEGTEMGPPGYLGVAAEVHSRLTSRGLALVGAFLPQHFSRAEMREEDGVWLQGRLASMRAAAPDGSTPIVVLCEAVDEPARLAASGAIAAHPETWLSDGRFEILIDALHRAGETCADAGFAAVIHPHAGTYIETADEIERLMQRLDPSLVGLCVDTGHFRYGGADPARCIRDYAPFVRHVHLKDCRTSVVERVGRAGGGFVGAVAAGCFTGLGEGDSGIAEAVASLRDIGYQGWLVVEQDQALTAADTRQTLVAGQRRNRDVLRALGL